jgi:hypothetical protein
MKFEDEEPMVLVRVRSGCRLRENGVVYVEGQTFWTTLDRLKDLIDAAERVQGVPVRTVDVAPPIPAFQPETKMPVPETRLVQPRVVKPVRTTKKLR